MFIVVIAAEILWLWGHFHCSEDLQLLKHFDLFVSVTPAFAQTQTPILYPQRRPRAISCHMACSQALDWACKLFFLQNSARRTIPGACVTALVHGAGARVEGGCASTF